jgi:hypothetical protein
MGAVSEMLNTLGYGEYSEENSSLVSIANVIDEVSSTMEVTYSVETPKGNQSTGICSGCELSARYF